MVYTHILLMLAWVFYCSLHSLLAALRVKNWVYRQAGIPAQTYRLMYNVVAIALLLLLCMLQLSIASAYVFKVGLISYTLGTSLALTGLVIMAIVMKKYFREMSGLYETTADNLQVGGLHRYVRHPLYLGTFCFIMGIFFCWPFYKNAVAMLVIIIYTLLAINLEEKKLVLQFGAEYQQYRKRVPMIIPFIARRRN